MYTQDEVCLYKIGNFTEKRNLLKWWEVKLDLPRLIEVSAMAPCLKMVH
jgi:hypothetical protein